VHLALGILALGLPAPEIRFLLRAVLLRRREPAGEGRARPDVDLGVRAAGGRLVGVVRDAARVDALVHLRRRAARPEGEQRSGRELHGSRRIWARSSPAPGTGPTRSG
jgi:hypothetical protein